MEQVRERGEPDTNSDSGGEDTITSGLGTGREVHMYINKFTQHARSEVCWSVMELTLNHDSSTIIDSPHQTNSWYVDVSLAGIHSSM